MAQERCQWQGLLGKSRSWDWVSEGAIPTFHFPEQVLNKLVSMSKEQQLVNTGLLLTGGRYYFKCFIYINSSTVGHEAVVGTGVGLGPLSFLPFIEERMRV